MEGMIISLSLLYLARPEVCGFLKLSVGPVTLVCRIS